MSDGDCPQFMCCGAREHKLVEQEPPKVSVLQLQALSAHSFNPLRACVGSNGSGRTRDFEFNVESIDDPRWSAKPKAPRPLALERAMKTAMDHEDKWAEWQVPSIAIPLAVQGNEEVLSERAEEDLGNGVYRLTLQDPPSRRTSPRDASGKFSSKDSQMDFYMPEQTVLMFDWDDTLFPSNWLQRCEGFFRALNETEKLAFTALQHGLACLLELALTLGRVIVVTNSSEPWVSISVRSFMPSLEPLMQKIPVLYARSCYEKGGERLAGSQGAQSARAAMQFDALAPQRWKEQVFHHQIGGFYSRYKNQSWKNVVCVGDQNYERDAARSVVKNAGHSPKCRLKTVKFMENPSIQELTAEIRVLHDSLNLMTQADGNLDVEIDSHDLEYGMSLAEKIIDLQMESKSMCLEV